MGHVALCPHSMTRFYQGVLPDEVWLEGTLELLRRCDAALFLEGWEQSEGSRAEMDEADRLRVAVLYDLAGLEWFERKERKI